MRLQYPVGCWVQRRVGNKLVHGIIKFVDCNLFSEMLKKAKQNNKTYYREIIFTTYSSFILSMSNLISAKVKTYLFLNSQSFEIWINFCTITR